MKILKIAVDAAGGQAALAAAIGVKQQHVWNWLNREGARVPAEHCPAIERATQGAVRCEDLRPDVAWDVLRMQTGQQAA
jgi:DNA-binding transcriptional regulator YdaS (Cro superfamily)